MKRDRRAASLLLCLVFFLSTAPGVADDSATKSAFISEKLPAETLRAIDDRDWRTIGETLHDLARRADASEPVHYWFGVAMLEQTRYKDAIPHLTAALEQNPHSRATAQYLARAGYFSKKSDAAIRRALDAFPLDPVVLTKLGRWHELRRSDEEAVRHLTKAVAMDPNSQEAHFHLGLALRSTFRNELALKHLLIAERLGPMGYDGYAALAKAYGALGDDDNAAHALLMAARAAPTATQVDDPDRAAITNDKWDYRRANRLVRGGRFREATELYREIFRRDFHNSAVRFDLGKAAYQAGDYALALFAFKEAYLADGTIDALAWSAQCAYDMEQDKLAVRLIDQAIAASKAPLPPEEEFDPPSDWLFLRGRARWHLGDQEAAATDLEAAALKAPYTDKGKWAIYVFKQLDDPFGIVRVAQAVGARNAPEEALEVLREVQRIWWFPRTKDRNGKYYRGGLAAVTFRARAVIHESIGNYRTAWREGGRNALANEWWAWLAVRAGELDAAERILRQIAEDPRSEWAGQVAQWGSTFVRLSRRDNNITLDFANDITDEGLRLSLDSAEKWAAVYSGDQAALDRLDSFDLLGVYARSFRGYHSSRGLVVEGLLPDSPLRDQVLPKDVITKVGEISLADSAGIQRLRESAPTMETTRILVRRNFSRLEINIDLSSAKRGWQSALPNNNDPPENAG